MISAFEIAEFVEKQENVIYNLTGLLFWLIAERMNIAIDSKEREALHRVIDRLIKTSDTYGPEGEEYPSWDRKSVDNDLVILWKYLHEGQKEKSK